MEISIDYLAVVVNSTIRMMTPILLVTLAAAICTKVKIFNIAMEGTMLTGAFFSIVANYYTHSVFWSVVAGAVSGMIVSAIVGFCIIKLKASPVVVGMATNTMMGGVTTYLLYVIFKTKGVFTDPSLVSLTKIDLPVIKDIPVIGTMLSGLTIIDYLAFVIVIAMHIFLYKTVLGYRLRAIGINKEAARSLGTPVEKYQFLTISLSGILCGLGGVLLSMGTVTLFIQNITSGRGYIAMAANNLGRSNPIGVLLSSLFFGFSQAAGNVLQNTSLKTQITASIPYIATVVALVIFSIKNRKNKVKKV
ncbi:ABC transporter permease [Clostridium nigeriense]|uniref:ABC transporter permease n=1 Tax=Clostridium nigeriense TaxID=1805470 RepID=UPI000835412B|nr:ABC transporter permease [Clostridium nigeriense]